MGKNEPERIAHYIIDNKRNVRIANFINMNLYYAWRGSELGELVDFTTTSPRIVNAVKLLEEKGIGANVRFGPMCLFRGVEKNYVGISSIGFDPYEWMNGTDAQFEVEPFDGKLVYERARQKLMLNNKVFADKCTKCTAKMICDGMDKTYLAQKGSGELQPYTASEFNNWLPWEIRPKNKLANQLKIKLLDGVRQRPVLSDKVQEPGVINVFSRVVTGFRKVCYYKMNDHIYLLEHIAKKNLVKEKDNCFEDGALGVPVLQLDSGQSIEVKLPQKISGQLQVCVITTADAFIRISSNHFDKRVFLRKGKNHISTRVNVSPNGLLQLSNEGAVSIQMADPVLLVPKKTAKIALDAVIYIRAYGLRRILKKIDAFSMRKGRGSRASR